MLDTFKRATANEVAAIREEMRVRKTNELFLLFVMGSQFDHLIFQAIAKLGVFCLVADPASATTEDVKTLSDHGIEVKGIVISGGPASVESEMPPFDPMIFDIGIPVFGICLGFQMWAKHAGAKVTSGNREFGSHELTLLDRSPLFAHCPSHMPVLQSHGDHIEDAGEICVLGVTYGNNGTIAAASYKHLYGVQFHPEVTETTYGEQMFKNFVFGICSAKDVYPASSVAEAKITKLRERIGDKNVLLALSGGTDSSVVAHLLRHAMADKGQLYGVYIKGIDRPDDEANLLRHFGNQKWITLIFVDATNSFLDALKYKTGMKEKRFAVRAVYKPILEEQAALVGASFISQGTLYTDNSESGIGKGGARKATIKVHHNTNLNFSLPELTPLDDCVKDGVRSIGREIGVPEELLLRHPFPGPGMVVRIEGEITREKLVMTRSADRIWMEELRRAGQYSLVWQAGAVVTQSMHATTKGDDAGSGPVIATWAVWSINGFTAQAAVLPNDLFARVQRRMGNEIPGIGGVVHRYSDKPFSTIEWG